MKYNLVMSIKDICLFIITSILFTMYFITFQYYDNNILFNLFGVLLIVTKLPEFMSYLLKLMEIIVGKLININYVLNNDVFTYTMILIGVILFVISILIYSLFLMFLAMMIIIIGACF